MTIDHYPEHNPATKSLPRALATSAGDFVFVSGQVARTEDGTLISGGIDVQTRQTLRNVANVLSLTGCSLDDVVKVTVWLKDPRDFEAFNRIYGEFFQGEKPARSTLQGQNMAGTMVEVEVIAYKP